jgi:hypothetical protein
LNLGHLKYVGMLITQLWCLVIRYAILTVTFGKTRGWLLDLTPKFDTCPLYGELQDFVPPCSTFLTNIIKLSEYQIYCKTFEGVCLFCPFKDEV